ncbi:unnamed protein product [Amaranthus hypochondriacus]
MGGSGDGEEKLQGLSCREEERILVSVRLRPLNEKEASRKEAIDWECINDTTIIYKNNSSPERSLYPNTFTFDRVFRYDCSTRQVYEEGAKAVVLSAVSGINSSVFAYGQTSSGKTFTMSGITEYTMEDIFDYIRKHKERDFQLKFSAMEIYNESVRDLLTEDQSPLRLLDDPERGTVVEKLTEETLRDWDHFKELLAICEAQRQIGETFLNEASSRSHQILRLTIESSTREFLGKNNCSTLTATLNFVDLAGSERASQALSAGSRLKEGSHINRSLLTLGTVIRKLSKGQTGHIPYRDSKLTRILQSSLGGNARTAVICTMSPARIYVEQSRNTLLFASCAKEVTTNARVNVVMSDKALVKHLQRELARLESELSSASPTSGSLDTDLLREKDFKIEELERRVKELTAQLDHAVSQIHNLQQGSGERRSVEWEEHSSYPRLHVRQASECSSDEASLVDHHSFDAQSPSFGNPESPDRHSRLSYDENYSTSDFDENLSPSEQRFIESPNEASLLMHIQTPVVEIDHPRVPEIYREQKGDLSEAHQHISAETGIQTKNSFESDLHDFPDETGEEISDTFEFRLQQVSDEYRSQSPYVEFDSFRVSDEFQEEALGSCEVEAVEQYQVCEALTETISNYDELGPQKTSETAKLQTGESLEKNCMEVQCVESLNPQNDIVLPEDQSKSLLLKDIEDYRCADDEQKQDSELENVNSSLQDSEEPSGWQLIDDEPEIQKPNSVDSSPQSSKMSASPSFSEEIKCEGKHERGDGEYTIEVEDTNRKQTTLCNEAPRIPIGAVQLDATEVAEVELSNHLDNIENYTSLSARKDFIKAKSLDQLQLQKFQFEDTNQTANNSIKNVKDVGLNPQDDLGDNSLSLSDVKKLQEEIIEFWDACNISLIHRTCFFLLFIKDGHADTIYMEVERRRLAYIKDSFSSGTAVILDGRKLTPISSKRALLSERKMLSKLVKRRLSKQERRDIYVRWGISLDSKKRGSQLANHLWVNALDMDHVMESANIIARLVRFSEPQVPKEVFGLNLTTTQGRRKSFSGSRILAISCKKHFPEVDP